MGYFLAAQSSCPLAGLVIADIGIDARPGNVQEVQALVDSLPPEFPNEAAAEAFLAARLSKDEAAYFRDNLSQTRPLRWLFSPGAMVETVRLGRGSDWISLAPRIACPVLLVRGETSQELSRDEAHRMTAVLLELLEVPPRLYA